MKFVKAIALALAVMCFTGSSTFAMDPTSQRSNSDFVFVGFSYDQLRGMGFSKQQLREMDNNGQISFGQVDIGIHVSPREYEEIQRNLEEAQRREFEEHLK